MKEDRKVLINKYGTVLSFPKSFNGVDDYVRIEGKPILINENMGTKVVFPFFPPNNWAVNIRFFPRALKDWEIHGIKTGKIKPFKCRKCNWHFISRSELMSHIWEFHRKKERGKRIERNKNNGKSNRKQ
jgi:hypothetical protein